MKTQKVLKITALSCIAVFALGVLIFGLVTGFGIEDVRALFEKPAESGYDTPYTYTEDLDYLDELVIDWPGGPVTLSLYDGDVVTVTETARRALEEEEKLALEIDGGTLSIRWNGAWLQAGISDDEAKRLEVQVPQTLAEDLSAVSIRTSSGDVSAAGFAAREISLETVSGDIDAAALRAGRLTLNSTSGEIRGENLEGTENVTAGNVSGETALTGVQAGTLALSSTSGAVAADGTAETLTCRSVSGAASLTLRSWPAEAEISTVSGGVAVRGPADESGFACVVSRCPAKRTAALTRRRKAAPTRSARGRRRCASPRRRAMWSWRRWPDGIRIFENSKNIKTERTGRLPRGVRPVRLFLCDRRHAFGAFCLPVTDSISMHQTAV